MPVNTGFYWSLGETFNEIFSDFSSRSLSGTGTSRTRPLHGCGRKSVLISLQNENAGYAKHAEVTVPSLADWEKDWQDNPQRNGQPKLLAVDYRSQLAAVVKSN
jgi:hypothetical protein